MIFYQFMRLSVVKMVSYHNQAQVVHRYLYYFTTPMLEFRKRTFVQHIVIDPTALASKPSAYRVCGWFRSQYSRYLTELDTLKPSQTCMYNLFISIV